MTEKYWKDYSEFIAKVDSIAKQTPAVLIDLYTDFLESIEANRPDISTLLKLEIDNDFNFRSQIQKVLTCKDLATNELKLEFQDKIFNLDKKLKTYLSPDCAKRHDWYKNIELNPDTFK